MRLWIDPSKLSAYKLTINDIRQALDRENIELPGGKIRGNTTQLIVKTFGKLTTETEFNDLILREDNNGVVRYKDVGYAELGADNEESVSRKNNVPSVNLGVVAQPGSNQIEIADEVYKRIKEIKKDMPPDIIFEVGYDRTTFVRNAISEVKETLLIAILLVVTIIFLFLPRMDIGSSSIDRYSCFTYWGILHHVPDGIFYQCSYIAGYRSCYRSCSG
jgi:multidrug efflux pump